MRVTQYDVYGTFDDLIKLYRRAIKKGYTAGDLHPLDEDDPNVSVQINPAEFKRYMSSGRRRWSKEFNCDVIVPELKMQKVKDETKSLVITGNLFKRGNTFNNVPNVLVYRNYSDRTLAANDYDIFKLTLTREY